MKPKLYIETSVISYLTARPSKNLLVAAHQQVTFDWWNERRAEFDLYISSLVLEEASQGDRQAVARRLSALKEIPLLELRSEARDLAERFLHHNVLPRSASEDSLHIAVTAVYGLDYLLTWNCRHIANAEIQKQVARIIAVEGYDMPTICTPLELSGG